MFIEFKVPGKRWHADKNHKLFKEDDDYHTVNQANVCKRNYYLFGKLAGVRCDGPEPKGLPKDASSLIKKASKLYGFDGHSHSYSSLEDFESILKDHIMVHGYYHGGTNVKIKTEKYLNEYLSEAEPVAFYEWDINKSYDYVNLLAYCKEQVKLKTLELEAEKHLLGVKGSTEVKCRLVYYFDN